MKGGFVIFFRSILFVCSFLSVSLAFSEDLSEEKKRLEFVQGEISKINQRISEGQDAKLFQKYLDKFTQEENELIEKLDSKKSKKEEASVSVKTKKKEKKVVKNKTKRNKKARKDNVRHTVYLNKSVSESELEKEINLKLEIENEKLLNHIERGKEDTEIRKSQANIAYLQVERTKLVRKREHSKSNFPKFGYRGHFQLRTEFAKNRQGVQGTDQAEQTVFRLRTYFDFKANDRLTFNLTPQAAKGFGANSSASATTSGSTLHTDLSFFEANVDYEIARYLMMKIGRQEVSYGDHFIIGSLPWANTGRSFDGLKFTYKSKKGFTDLFYSKISDNFTSRIPSDDVDLYVLYNSYELNQYLKPLDVYYIYQDDEIVGNPQIHTLGVRVKGQIGPIFYRTEDSIQKGKGLGENGYQYNLEIGGKVYKYTLSAEYAVAGSDYRQLYPTGHKFLGFADVLGRRNIRQIAFHLKGDVISWLGVRADYHIFSRPENTKSAYQLLGGSWGSLGNSTSIGSEVDLVFTFKVKHGLKFQLGGSIFTPGDYMKDQNAGVAKATHFAYLQMNASF
ncbi:MAG: hypothetical protein CL678_09305 [Bdellovibrionaceae bacterium]|nr:hypothetical protein [Pseudobdellovibrionaceae bacterium]